MIFAEGYIILHIRYLWVLVYLYHNKSLSDFNLWRKLNKNTQTKFSSMRKLTKFRI